MFTNPQEQEQVRRQSSIGHMLKRFTSLAAVMALLGGGYSLMSNDGNGNSAVAQVAEVAQPAAAALNPVGEPTDVMDSGASIVQGLGQTLTSAIQQSTNGGQAGMQTAPLVVQQDDGLEHSFYDLTFNKIETLNGTTVGQITDVLIDPATGAGTWIIFKPENADMAPEGENMRYAVRGNMIESVSTIGDLQIENTDTMTPFSYTPEIYDTALSLKNLRGASVLDAFQQPVGRISNLIYNHNRFETVYIQLAPEMAPAGGRHEFSAANVKFQRANGEYQLVLNEEQTKDLAEKLYARN